MLNPAESHAVNSIITKGEHMVRAAQSAQQIEPIKGLFQQILEIGKPKSPKVIHALQTFATKLMMAVQDRIESRMTPKLEYEVDDRVMSIIDHWQSHYGYKLVTPENRDLYNAIHAHQSELLNQHMNSTQ